MLHGDVIDELLNNDRFADTGAAEETDFPTAQIRFEKIDYLNAGLEHLKLGRLFIEFRGAPVNRSALVCLDRAHVVHRLPEYVQYAPKRLLADGNGDRFTQIVRFHASHQ